MELPTMTEKKNAPRKQRSADSSRQQKRENPAAGSTNTNSRKPQQAAANNRRPDNKRREGANRQSAPAQKPETKNVTVRTFGRKKTQEENK